MTAALGIDRQQIASFADALLRYASDGVHISMRAFLEGQPRPLRIAAAKVNGAGVQGVLEAAYSVATLAAVSPEAAVFCPPIAGFTSATQARQADLAEAYALSVECDAKAAEARTVLEGLLGPATVVVTSGGDWSDPTTGELEPKLHLHWRLSEPAQDDDLARLKEARRRATLIVGGDPSNIPMVHPIRWPGSVHRKATPRLAQIIALNEGVEIDLAEAAELLAERAKAAGSTNDRGQAHADGARKGDADAEYETLVANVLRGDDLHASLDRLAAKMVASGMFPGAVVMALRGMMRASFAPRDARWQSRFDDIWRDVKTAEAKYRPKEQEQPRQAEETRAANDETEDAAGSPAAQLWAKPFVWRDPQTIPRREWLYGGHFIRRFVSTTTAPGGIGKSALLIAEAVAMASGKPILGVHPTSRLRVWYWNGEDPLEETERRIAAVAIRYGLARCDLEDWLFLGSGREAELVIAEQLRGGTHVIAPNVAAMKAMIGKLKIDLAIIDPFISSHRVPENDNGAIDRVAKAWGNIAECTNAGVELVHHTRKRANVGDETTVEDGRGAVSLLAAARSARALNTMTVSEAEKSAVENHRAYFRADNGKANLMPPPDGSTWFKFASVSLDNGGLEGGDSIGVVTSWAWPNHLDSVQVSDLVAVQRKVASGVWRENAQAKDWVGYAVADVLACDASDRSQQARIKALLKIWISSGALAVVSAPDGKGMMRPFVEVGRWVSEKPETVSQ